ncbi:MAG: hypothetical protein ABIP29_06870, partial [Candidatus Eisenbacteria bacterium]
MGQERGSHRIRPAAGCVENLAAGARARQGQRLLDGRRNLARSNSFLIVFLRYWLPVFVYVAIIFALS